MFQFSFNGFRAVTVVVPLPEPVRMQDSEDTALSRTEKKIKKIISLKSFPHKIFCQTFTSCYLSCNVLKYKVKRLGCHVRLRDIIVSISPNGHMFI